jgi:hypothetical protein
MPEGGEIAMNNDKSKTSKQEKIGKGKVPASDQMITVKKPDAANQMLDAVISRGWTLTS